MLLHLDALSSSEPSVLTVRLPCQAIGNDWAKRYECGHLRLIGNATSLQQRGAPIARRCSTTSFFVAFQDGQTDYRAAQPLEAERKHADPTATA